MSLSDAIAALEIYGENANWAPDPSYMPEIVDHKFVQQLKDVVAGIYQQSAAASLAFETVLARGPIRVGLSGADDAYGLYLRPQSPTPASEGYLLINLNAQVSSIDSHGNVFQMSAASRLMHEMGHYAYDYQDPAQIVGRAVTDADLDNPSFDAVGSSLRYEQQMDQELGLSSSRVSYYSAVGSASGKIYDEFLSQDNWSMGEAVTTVRVGGVDMSVPNNTMDYSSWESDTRLLALGLNGSDNITGSQGDDYIYGNSGEDVLHGGDGSDHIFGNSQVSAFDYLDGENQLFGGEGADFLYAGSKGDTLHGDGGDDTLNGGISSDYLDGGEGADVLDGGEGADILDGGSGGESDFGGDIINVGYGDTVINVDEFDRIYFNGRIVSGGQNFKTDPGWDFEPAKSGDYYDDYGRTYSYDRDADTLIVFDGTGSFTITQYDNSFNGADAHIYLQTWGIIS